MLSICRWALTAGQPSSKIVQGKKIWGEKKRFSKLGLFSLGLASPTPNSLGDFYWWWGRWAFCSERPKTSSCQRPMLLHKIWGKGSEQMEPLNKSSLSLSGCHGNSISIWSYMKERKTGMETIWYSHQSFTIVFTFQQKHKIIPFLNTHTTIFICVYSCIIPIALKSGLNCFNKND